MENNQRSGQTGQENQPEQQQQNQQQQGENPTLGQPGSSVADYGNVMGGSSDENAQHGHKTGTGRQDSSETIGNP